MAACEGRLAGFIDHDTVCQLLQVAEYHAWTRLRLKGKTMITFFILTCCVVNESFRWKWGHTVRSRCSGTRGGVPMAACGVTVEGLCSGGRRG